MTGVQAEDGGRTVSSPASANAAADAAALLSGKFHYVARGNTGIVVYDIENGHRHVKTIPIPNFTAPRGITGSAATGKLYISDGHNTTNAEVIALDLATDAILWRRVYSPGVDSLCVTPNGSTIYLPTGEEHAGYPDWLVLDAATGNLLTRIPFAPHGHNTLCNLDGTRVYLGAQQYPYLGVVDTATNQVVKRVGPLGEGVRPFTINGTNTLAFVNVNYLLGFEVADLRTEKRLYRVEVPGFPKPDTCTRATTSHGIAVTPDERALWVADACYRYLHAFDISGLPLAAPRKVADIKTEGHPGWVSFSLDGRFAYITSGEVFNVATRQRVAKLVVSSRFLEVHFQDGRPVRVGSRHSVGHMTGRQFVDSFTLVNADTDRDIRTLRDGDTISFSAIGTKRLSIRANTTPSTVGSVKFGLDANANYKIENSAPYAIAGGTSTDYAPWTPTVGTHRLTATPYTGASASGTAGIALRISFTVTS